MGIPRRSIAAGNRVAEKVPTLTEQWLNPFYRHDRNVFHEPLENRKDIRPPNAVCDAVANLFNHAIRSDQHS